MKRTLFGLAGLPALALLNACGAHAPAPALSVPLAHAKASHVIPVMIDDDLYADANPLTSPRAAGDFLVREITSASRKTPLVISERVLSTDGASALLEVSFKDGQKTETFRVHVEETAAGEQTTEVTKLIGATEHAFGVAAYEAMLGKAVPSVDRNDGLVDAEPITVDVSGKSFPATRSEYKVMVAGKPAMLSVVESKAIGDVGGEVSSADGKVLFRTRILDMGKGGTGTASR